MKRTIIGAAALLALAGCGAGTTGTSEALMWAPADITERTDLYVDTELASLPLTAVQLGGLTESTVPVEIEIFGEVAAAWDRSPEHLGSRTRADLVALWRVVDGQPISGELDHEGEDGPIYRDVDELPPQVDTRELIEQTIDEDQRSLVLIDFRDLTRIPLQQDVRIWRQLQESHPGCE